MGEERWYTGFVPSLQSFGHLAALLAVCASALSPAQAADVESTSHPYAGTTYTVYVEASIPARIHVLEVDLTSSEISLLPPRVTATVVSTPSR